MLPYRPSRIRPTIALAMTLWLAACGSAPQQAGFDTVDEQFLQLAEQYAAQRLALSPTLAQQLGDQRRNAEWDDRSVVGNAAQSALRRRTQTQLAAIERRRLTPAQQLNFDLLQFLLDQQTARAAFPLHNHPLNARDGVHLYITRQLIDWHSINSVADAEAYINRVQAVGDVVDQSIAAAEARRTAGIIAPRFTLQRSLAQIEHLSSGIPLTAGGGPHPLWADFNAKLDALRLPEDEDARLRGLLRIALGTRYRLALQRLHDNVLRQASVAEEMGAWNLPDGDAYYRMRLAIAADDDLTPDNLHHIGKLEVARLKGMIEGVIAELGLQMDFDPFQRYARNNAGFNFDANPATGDAMVAALAARTATSVPQLNALFPPLPITPLTVETNTDRSASAISYRPAPHGARLLLNVARADELSRWQIAAAAYGYGVPGRHLQYCAARADTAPLAFREHLLLPAYRDGWRLYAEALAHDAGLYIDPWENYGRLVREMRASVALVIDTGIHHRRWTSDRALEYAVDHLPLSQQHATHWVHGVMVHPGAATSAKRGLIKILELRDSARHALGAAFDLREFHSVLLEAGPLPLGMLAQRVAAWIDRKKTQT